MKKEISEEINEFCIFQDGYSNPDFLEELANQLNVKIENTIPNIKSSGLWLQADENGLALAGNGQMLRGDFSKKLSRLKQANLQGEMIVKAAKMKEIASPVLVDATAGMGEDSLILAAFGFRVIMYEYDPIIFALLKDTVIRAEKIPELTPITERMELHGEDSVAALPSLKVTPDVVLLDPMFPERQKSSLVKKKFQLLHQLEQPCSDEESMLSAAISAKPKKIVIKRPAKGPFLAGKKPDYSYSGKAVRFDCILLH